MSLSKVTNLVFARKNTAFWGIKIILLLVLTALFVVSGILKNHQYKLVRAKGNVYGYFYSLLYQTAAESAGNDEDLYKSAVNVKKVKLEDGTLLRIGTADDIAADMAYRGDFSLYNDTLSDQALLVESTARQRNVEAAASITIGKKQVQITSIVPEIGYLWLRGEREEKEGHLLPELWVNLRLFSELDDAVVEDSYRIRLYNYEESVNLNPAVLQGKYYENVAMIRDDNLFAFKTPPAFFAAQIAALAMITLMLIHVYTLIAEKRYEVYADSGLNKHALNRIRTYEILFLTLPVLLPAYILSGIVVYITSYFLYGDSEFFSLTVHTRHIGNLLTAYVLTILIAILVKNIKSYFFTKEHKALKVAVKLDKMPAPDKKGKRSFGFFVSALPLKRAGIFTAVLPLLILLSFTAASVYAVFHQSGGQLQQVELEGQFKQNFDFELLKLPQNLPPFHLRYGEKLRPVAEGENFFPFFHVEQGERLAEIAAEIATLEGVKRVDKFYENHHAFISLPPAVIEENFLQRLQQTSIYSGMGNDVFTRKFIQEDIDALVKCDIISMPENDLTEIAMRLNLGSSLEALRQGESAILISPSLRITRVTKDKYGGEAVYWERTTQGDGLSADPLLLSYRKAVLYLPYAQDTLTGFITERELLAMGAELKRMEFVLAGSSYENIAWFPITDYQPAPYRLLLSEAYLRKSAFAYAYAPTRIRVYLESETAHESVGNSIQRLINAVPDLQFNDNHYRIKIWHQFQRLKALVIGIYVLLFLILTVAVALSTVEAFCLANRRNFVLYRDLGITLFKLFKLCFIRCSGAFVILAAMQLTLSFTVFNYTVDGWFDVTDSEKLFIQMLIGGAYLLFSLILLFVKVRVIFRSDDYRE